MNSRAVIACAIGAVLSGCASAGRSPAAEAARSVPSGAYERLDHGNPALVFATPEMRQMLAQRGLAPGFGWDDWEYGRNDQRVSVGASRVNSAGYGAFEITQYDRLYESNGRPRSSSQTTIRSVRAGQSR